MSKILLLLASSLDEVMMTVKIVDLCDSRES